MNTKSLLESDMESLVSLIDLRLSELAYDKPYQFATSFQPLDAQSDDYYAKLLMATGLSLEERVIFILSLAPYIKPEFLFCT